ncbi:MAG: hypothetical protein HUJ25_08695 [Crocinitomicaceae bacterium]|nr:hypothetical protein [Crocinitomicaceae bacterium]
MKALYPALLFCFNISFGQNEIGKTYNEIKTKYKAAEYDLKEEKGVDMLEKISINLPNANVTFIFDIWTKKCNSQIIYPKTEKDQTNLIKQYNDTYVSKSNQLWVRYFEGYSQEIHLEYSEISKEYYFVWRIPERVTNNQ